MDAGQFEIARQRAQHQRTERVAVGLERMGSPAELAGVARGQRAVETRQHQRRFGQEGIDQLAHELRARGLLQLLEGRLIDRGLRHLIAPGVRARASAPRPGASPLIGLER